MVSLWIETVKKEVCSDVFLWQIELEFRCRIFVGKISNLVA